MKKLYEYQHYVDRHKKTIYSARKIISLVRSQVTPIQTAVDFGCGVGTWLSVLKEDGCNVLGVDGPWVDKSLLEIPVENFKTVDLKKKIDLTIKYDLAISLEVAEHLPPESADIFIESLVGASDCILFSAAIPFQSGLGHINEQWQNYWVAKFKQKDYIAMDFIRPAI